MVIVPIAANARDRNGHGASARRAVLFLLEDDNYASSSPADHLDDRDKTAQGLVAVERFTGRGFTPEDLERIEEADVAYRIMVD